MREIILNADVRELPTPSLNTSKKQGRIPAEIYGHDQKNQHLFLNAHDFNKIYEFAGESSLVDLHVAGGSLIKVLIHNIQREPITGNISHVDFLQVKMDEEINANIPLVFIGESKAVKEFGGTLVKLLEEVEVSCLPMDLIHELEVDISPLNTFDDAIRVADLNFSDKIKVITSPETTIAVVLPQKVETVEAAPAAQEVAAIGEVQASAEGEKEEGSKE